MIGDVAKLTRRQRECLRLVPELGTSKRIADRMGLEPASVDKTLHRAMRTLGVTTRAEAAAMLLANEAAPSINLDSPPSRPPVSIPRPVGSEGAVDAYPLRPEAERSVVAEERLGYRSQPMSFAEVMRRFLFEPGERDDLTQRQKLKSILIWFLLGIAGASLLSASLSQLSTTARDVLPKGPN